MRQGDRQDLNNGGPDVSKPATAARYQLNPLERLIFRWWPSARHWRYAGLLKKAPPKLLRLAILIDNPYPVERMLERPSILRRRLMRAPSDGRTLALAYGFEYVKRKLLRSQLPQYRIVFLPFGKRRDDLAPAVAAAKSFTLIVWSFRDQAAGLDRGFWGDGPTIRVEDGFIRSVGLGSDGALPYSLCIDRSGLYFDATAPSDLETIANTYDFDADDELLKRADIAMDRIRRTGITKYNFARKSGLVEHENRTERSRVLVIGQVEDDQSIMRNRCAIATNEGLVRRAIEDNPDADIVYRAHPDVTSGNRRALSDPTRLLPAYRDDPPGTPLSDAIDAADIVYTISSLSGFEALMRGKKVKTFGGPFYAGWGLTDDAMPFTRRTRRLSLRELFAASYILYPVYFDPRSGERLTIEAILDKLERA